MAETTGNRFENIDSALLLTEYKANKDAEKELKGTIQAQRDEIQRRLEMGITVENATTSATLTTARYKTYNVRRILTAVRKFKLDPAAILKGINKAIEALPPHILESIPYVVEESERVTLKPRK